MGWNLWVSQCCEVLPHVLVADDLDNGAGHLGAAQADPLQQRLQPPHIALHVRVQERQDVACGQKPRAPSGTPQADGTTAPHPGTSQNFSGKQSYSGGSWRSGWTLADTFRCLTAGFGTPRCPPPSHL